MFRIKRKQFNVNYRAHFGLVIVEQMPHNDCERCSSKKNLLLY